jgi:nucleotide-binding universal stress UspA family protein
MTTPIVVGVDVSPDARAAAFYAATLAARRGAPLKLVHAHESLFFGYGPLMVASSYAIADDKIRRSATTFLDDLVDDIRAAHPGLVVTSQLTDGRAAAVLIAESRSAEVTVLGSRGVGGFAGLLLGSVSAQVAAHGHGAVLVVRPAADPDGPVLVGYDGSAASSAALTFGVKESLGRKVPLVVANVYWEDLDIRHPAPADPAVAAARTAGKLISDAVELPSEQHPELDVKILPVHGRKADQALAKESAHAALTVVGCRGRGGFAGLLLGSVSRTLVHHAAGSVAVIHPINH